MIAEEAFKLIEAIPEDVEGAWFQLRLGNDPGADHIKKLRIALRTAWHATKHDQCLPRILAEGAAFILHFSSEAKQNISKAPLPRRPELLESEIEDLQMGAFELLSGQSADQWVVRRPDLGDTF